ncbi:MAG: T9SS type A sorting domain-containing protein [Bacteroidota bacterium]
MKSNSNLYIFLLGLSLTLWPCLGVLGQTTYDLSFDNPKLNSNPLSLTTDILISFDKAGKLGSCNLVIDYDPALVHEVKMKSIELSKGPVYIEPTFRILRPGRVSLNIELVSNGSGDEVGTAEHKFRIGQLMLGIHSTQSPIILKWYESSSKGTVVFNDDPAFTQLFPGNLQDLQFNPSDYPLDELMLTVVQQDLDAQLDWQAMSSSTLMRFDVERSLDGQLFEKIATINPDQNASEAYQYLDKDVVRTFEGSLFYRLRQLSLDGSMLTSNTVELVISPTAALNLQAFPNPIKDKVTIQWADFGGKAEVKLINAAGQMIKSEMAEEGQSNMEWDLGKLSPGLYFIKYINSENEDLKSTLTVTHSGN